MLNQQSAKEAQHKARVAQKRDINAKEDAILHRTGKNLHTRVL